MSAGLTVSRHDKVLVAILDRPQRRNAIGVQLQGALARLWAEVREDADVRCVLLTGAGSVFCAGADLGDLAAMTGPNAAGRIEFCPSGIVDVPVVVAVNGPCVGAGLRFVADADIVLAAESAWFSDPHVSLGQIATPVALALAEKASASAVTQLFLAGSGNRLSAAGALTAGIVGQVVPDHMLRTVATDLAVQIAEQSPSAVRQTVSALRQKHRRALGPLIDEAWSAAAEQRRHPAACETLAAAAGQQKSSPRDEALPR